jgi:RNA recognition motif-containing protein
MAEGEKPMRIVIQNLPKDVSEEEIREALKPFAQVGAIKLIKEGSAPATLIEVESRELADVLVRRINGHFYKGQRLAAWVPLWTE